MSTRRAQARAAVNSPEAGQGITEALKGSARLLARCLRLCGVEPMFPVGLATALEALGRPWPGALAAVHATTAVRHRARLAWLPIPAPLSGPSTRPPWKRIASNPLLDWLALSD